MAATALGATGVKRQLLPIKFRFSSVATHYRKAMPNSTAESNNERRWQIDHLIAHVQGVEKSQTLQLWLILAYTTIEWSLLLLDSKNASLLGIQVGSCPEIVVPALNLGVQVCLLSFRSATQESKLALEMIEKIATAGGSALPAFLGEKERPWKSRLWNIDEHMNFIDFVETSVARLSARFGQKNMGPLVYPLFEMIFFLFSWLAVAWMFGHSHELPVPQAVTIYVLVLAAVGISAMFVPEWAGSLCRRWPWREEQVS
jgi:hypothetical protein